MQRAKMPHCQAQCQNVPDAMTATINAAAVQLSLICRFCPSDSVGGQMWSVVAGEIIHLHSLLPPPISSFWAESSVPSHLPLWLSFHSPPFSSHGAPSSSRCSGGCNRHKCSERRQGRGRQGMWKTEHFRQGGNILLHYTELNTKLMCFPLSIKACKPTNKAKIKSWTWKCAAHVSFKMLQHSHLVNSCGSADMIQTQRQEMCSKQSEVTLKMPARVWAAEHWQLMPAMPEDQYKPRLQQQAVWGAVNWQARALLALRMLRLPAAAHLKHS